MGGILLLLAILFLLILSLPTILTTSWGQSQIIRFVNHQIPGKIEVQTIHLSWFGSQKIEGFKLYDPRENLVLAIDHTTLNAPLTNLITQGLSSALKAEIKGLEGKIVRDQTGISNLHQSLGIESAFLNEKVAAPFEINLYNVNANLNITSANQPLHIQFSGQLESKGIISQIEMGAEVEQGGLPENIKVLQAKIKGFPVDLLEQLISLKDPRLGSVLLAALGNTLDLTLDHHKNEKSIHLELHAQSPNLKADFNGALSSDGFDLQVPGKIAFTITPELINRLATSINTEIALTQPTSLELIIDRLKIPSPLDSSDFNLSKAEVQAHVNLENAFLAKLPIAESMTMHDFRINVEKLTGGKQFNIALSGYADYNSLTSKIDLHLTSDLALQNINVQGILDPFALKGMPSGNEVRLENVRFNLESHPFQESQFHLTTNLVALGSIAELQIGGSINLEDKGFIDLEKLHASLTNKYAHIDLKGKIDSENRIILSFRGNTALAKYPKQGNLDGQIEIRDWTKGIEIDFTNAAVNAQLHAINLPAAIVESFTNQTQLASLIGPSFDVNLNAFFSGNDPSNGFLSVAIDGEQFKGNANLKIGEYITLQDPGKPAHLHYMLTPARFEALRNNFKKDNHNPDHIVLLENTELKANVSDLKLPLSAFKSNQNPSLKSDVEFQANVRINQFKAKDKATDQFLGFENITANLHSRHPSRELSFSLHAQQTDRRGNKSDLVVNGELENLMTSDHRINTADMSIKLQAHAKKLPANLFCEIVCVEKATRIKLEALLGPVLDAEIAVQLKQMNGHVQGQLEGSNGRIQMDAMINNGWLTLNKPFVAEVAATPELGKSVLQDMLPILSGMIGAENRLQIIIDPSGFAFPIGAESLEQVQIGWMTIDLGKVHFSNQGQLGKIMSVLKAKPQDVISVWFTPIYLTMQSGNITIQRFDMLAMDVFPLAAWGTIDLPGDYINMMIGLSGQSLKNTIGLPSIDKNYMMQFPFRGRIGKASIDKSKAASRIAALAASLTGTPQGLAIGAVIGLASGSLTEEKAPSPTTNPFPWESNGESQNDPDSSDTSSNEQNNHSKNPLKSIKKGAENLLHNLFR